MAQLKNVWSTKLGASGEGELSVVREDHRQILISVVEVGDSVRHRITFSLTGGQALGLARFLAGISSVMRAEEQIEAVEDEGDLTPPLRPNRESRPPSVRDTEDGNGDE